MPLNFNYFNPPNPLRIRSPRSHLDQNLPQEIKVTKIVQQTDGNQQKTPRSRNNIFQNESLSPREGQNDSESSCRNKSLGNGSPINGKSHSKSPRNRNGTPQTETNSSRTMGVLPEIVSPITDKESKKQRPSTRRNVNLEIKISRDPQEEQGGKMKKSVSAANTCGTKSPRITESHVTSKPKPTRQYSSPENSTKVSARHSNT